MLWVMIRKQFTEIFRNCFYDQKKGRMRRAWQVFLWFSFFAVLMLVMMVCVFGLLAYALCDPLIQAGMDWLYFLLMGGMSLVISACGSVFNTYSSLYLSRDNDLLLSLPIPVNTIMASRLINVYLLGAVYALCALIPTYAVYWYLAGVTLRSIIGAVSAFVIVTVFSLILSCLLGYVVARISVKLKNRSLITVLLSLLFVAVYYYFYFKAGEYIEDLVMNAMENGEKIRGYAFFLYLFGKAGEGDLRAIAVYMALTVLLFMILWMIMESSFLKITGSISDNGKVKYVEKPLKKKKVFAALLGKEFDRFLSSPNYMLNCGLGTLMIPVSGVAFLMKGDDAVRIISQMFGTGSGMDAVMICATLFTLCSMNSMAAVSVSLEGKDIWILQSLPVLSRQALKAKLCVQLLLTGIPVAFATVCALIALKASLSVSVLIAVTSMLYVLFLGLFDLCVGLKLPVMNWVNEIRVIKQSAAIMIALFGSFLFAAAMVVLYLFAGYRLGETIYLLIWTIFLALGSFILNHWMERRGSGIFEGL